jgi:enoyl-CoA hydratase/carnithine racemase
MTQTSATQIRLERRSPSYWRVTFDIPPLNIFGPKDVPQLNEIIARLETDEHVKVVVFDSAVEGFFLTHYDFLAKPEDQPSMPAGRTGLQPLPDMLARLSRAPVVSIVSIRGALQASGASSRWQAICVLRVGKKPSCRNGRLVLAWFQAAAPWLACPAS